MNSRDLFKKPMIGKIVIVLAHPDDESYGIGGTIAKYSSEGVEVHLITATNGEKAKFTNSPKIITDLGLVRKQELHEAGKILGITKIYFFDYPDQLLDEIPLDQLKLKIRNILIEINPQIVITFDSHGITGHPDHKYISKAATEVFFEIKQGMQSNCDEYERTVSKLYYFTIPQSWLNSLPLIRKLKLSLRRKFKLKGTADENITTAIDISSFALIKKKACESHQSQLHNFNRIKRSVNDKCFMHEYFVLVNLNDFDTARIKQERDLFEGLFKNN